MDGYQDELTEDERQDMPWLVLARWLHSRADAARRKIPEKERVAYVVEGLLAPLDEINRACFALWGRGLRE